MRTTKTIIGIIALGVFYNIDRGYVCPMVSQHCGDYDLDGCEFQMSHSQEPNDHARIEVNISSWFFGSK